jgi:hypothetical protein
MQLVVKCCSREKTDMSYKISQMDTSQIPRPSLWKSNQQVLYFTLNNLLQISQAQGHAPLCVCIWSFTPLYAVNDLLTSLVWMFCTMYALMSLQITLLPEWLIAHISVVWMFSAMYAMMSPHITLLPRFIRHNTRIWAFSTVYVLVNLQLTLFSEKISYKHHTYIWIFSKNSLMCLQMMQQPGTSSEAYSSNLRPTLPPG